MPSPIVSYLYISVPKTFYLYNFTKSTGYRGETMARDNFNRIIAFSLFLVFFLSILPLLNVGAIESNHVHTKLDPELDTTIYFDPSAQTEFTIIFYSETRDFDIHMNYSAVDSGGEFNLTNWEITFDPADFTVGYSEEVTVTITMETNFTTADKGRSIILTVWGDVADDDQDDIDTNSQNYEAIIAERDDVVLSVNAENEMKLVEPQKEAKFNVFITNTGWSANSIRLTARILDDNADQWTVRVIYQSFDGVQSQETRTGTINVTSPEIVQSGDYVLEVKALVGEIGSDTIDLKARVALPDFIVSEIIPSHNPVLDGVKIQIKAVIENNGGYAFDVNVRADVKGHLDKWEHIPDYNIESITNYNKSYAIFSWNAKHTDKSDFSETWTIRIVVDDLLSIEETDEGNNQGEAQIIVRGIAKKKVSFNPEPALIILGIMMVFTGAVALDSGNKKITNGK